MANKMILIVTEKDADDYEPELDRTFAGDNRVLVKGIDPTSGEKLRGYGPDLIILTTAVSADVMQRVIEPMTAIGGEIIELY